jgi:hypothetical protein
MEPLNDKELRELLRRWEVPPAPAHVRSRIFGERPPSWRWLLTGSIRVPVPAMALVLTILGAVAFLQPSKKEAPAVAVREVRLSDFQPVSELKPRIIRSNHEGD